MKGSVTFRLFKYMQRLQDSVKIYRFTLKYNVNVLMKISRKMLHKNNLIKCVYLSVSVC
ncbi:hypothetical protein HHS_01980 [Candidatus Pantoea carbekii]|uniref:Uncharacterized protein n=1 Tax=Candidatus Pantoea carbekii TaxID=1235990 RepID=U3U918_9GAMM|nr:hypothetical protein HHS_01980 [Candidatus Pantoea carbekii]